MTAADGTLIVGTPVNITNSPGYDNQPSFTPDGREILFTSARVIPTPPPPAPPGLALRDGQTDIYRYDIAARRISRVTQTPGERVFADRHAGRQSTSPSSAWKWTARSACGA